MQRMLGQRLSADEVVLSLRKMGVFSLVDSGMVYVTVPEYRNDFLHPVDIMEDVMIGYGLGNFAPELPNDSTVGRITVEETFARKVKDIMVGLASKR